MAKKPLTTFHPAALTMAKKPLPAGFEKPNKDELLQLIKIYSSLHTESITRTASSSSEDIDALPPPEVVKRIEALMEKIGSSAEKIDFTMPEHLKSWCAYKKTGLVGEDADRFLLERMKNKDNEPSELNNDNKDGKQVVLGVLDAIIELLEEKNKIFGFLQLFYWCHHLFEKEDEPYLAVEYICSVLGCAQSTLNIHDSDYGAGPTAPAGSVSGLLSFKIDGIEKVCSNTNRTTFPRCTSKVADMKNHGALFVLLVQSVEVLNDLIKCNFCNDYPCILIAGRKYPTAAVVSFSKRVSEELKLPLFCFLDWDPLSWKLLLGCGGAGPNQLPSYTKWLGIRPSDISELDLPECEMNDDEFDYLKTIDEYLMKQEPQVKRTKVETIALYAHGFKYFSGEVFVPCRLKQIIEKEIEKFNHMSSKLLIMREQAAIAKFNHMTISPQ